MTNSLSYSGVVTLIKKVAGKTLSRTFYNNGTNRLFEAYARAISGQNIDKFIPQYVRVYETYSQEHNGEIVEVKEERTRNPIPIVINYMSDNDSEANFDVPYARISVVILKNMIDLPTNLNSEHWATLELYSSSVGGDATKLAAVTVDDLLESVKEMTGGAQILIQWDLCILNATEGGLDNE